MDVSPAYLRFFFASCFFGGAIAVMGCATNNWSRPLFINHQAISDSEKVSDATGQNAGEQDKTTVKAPKPFWKQGFGEMSGMDPRSREIERSLGF